MNLVAVLSTVKPLEPAGFLADLDGMTDGAAVLETETRSLSTTTSCSTESNDPDLHSSLLCVICNA